MQDRLQHKKLARFAKKFPAVAIIGPRQCGKTTLAKVYAEKANTPFLYLDLEKTSDRAKLENAELFFGDNEDKTLILDEIQLMPQLFSSLRSAIDQNRKPLRFLLLGSAHPNLIRSSAESLAGRITYIELQPFNLFELDKTKTSVNDHFFYGGFPEVILDDDVQQRRDWLDQFINTYIQRDLPLYGLQASQNQTRRLVEMMAWNAGTLLNYSSLGKSLGVSHNTLKAYLDFLEGAFMLFELKPFHPNIKKRLTKSSKFYFTDSGLLHRLLRLINYNELLGTPFLGNSWEGYVITQIIGLKNDDTQLYFYRTYSGAEMDLVLVKGQNPVASIEIKFSESPSLSRGNTSSINDLGTENNFIVIPGVQDYRKSETLTVCGLEVFLEFYLPNL